MKSKVDMEYDKILIINDLFLAETGIDFYGYKVDKTGSNEFKRIRQCYFWFLNEFTNLTELEIGKLFGYYDKRFARPCYNIKENIALYNNRLTYSPSDKREHQRLLKIYETYTIKPHQVSDYRI
jgi:hypothetical protein